MKSNPGQMLIEALVALSIFMIALTAVTVTVITAVANSRFTQDQNSANKYAQEGIEKLRSLRSSNSALFFDPDRKYDTLVVYSMGATDNFPRQVANPNQPNIAGKFVRNVEFDDTPPAQANCSGRLVIVTVKWNSSKCGTGADSFCHKSRQTTCFTPAGN